MSGGGDSAVALLRSVPNAIGVTLRLWLDPQGPDTERAGCVPEAGLQARATCPEPRPPPRLAAPRRRRAARPRPLRARRLAPRPAARRPRCGRREGPVVHARAA